MHLHVYLIIFEGAKWLRAFLQRGQITEGLFTGTPEETQDRISNNKLDSVTDRQANAEGTTLSCFGYLFFHKPLLNDGEKVYIYL